MPQKGRVKKQTKADFLRSWSMPEGFRHDDLRYKSPPEKGIYWYFFSLYVRKRDMQWASCISCERPIGIETSNAGHFMPAADCGRDLLFDEQNVNAECRRCNAFDETHLLGYAENLDKRYGAGTAYRLRGRRDAYKAGPVVKDWSRAEYVEKIKALPSYQQVLDEVLR